LEGLLANDEEELDITLEIKPERQPVLSATFLEPQVEGLDPKVRLPQRTLAVGAGILTDGKAI
jgi:hypothetical protein